MGTTTRLYSFVLATACWLTPASGQQPWRQLADPGAAGWDAEVLRQAKELAAKRGSAAVMALVDDQVIVAWGDVERRFKCHSVRKSLVSALFGIAIGRGLVDPQETLADLGIDDLDPLSEIEKTATVEHLLAARSGVYHPAAKEPDDMKKNRPERHSRRPGEAFHYNNWDFNTLGTIFERRTGKNVFEAFEEWIARPLGMQDFRRADGAWELEPGNSRHPAYAFRLSARDLARFGLLYARGGEWGDEQVVPEDWIERSTRPVTEFQNGTGYGLMWWVYPQGTLPELEQLNPYDVFAAIGTGGQTVIVVPQAEYVFVHRADTDNRRSVRGGVVWQLANTILSAHPTEHRSGEDETRELAAEPLPGALPPPPDRAAIPVSADVLRELAGTWLIAPIGRCKAFVHDGRLFVRTPIGQENELLCEAEDRYFSKTDNVVVTVVRGEDGAVEALELEMRGVKLRGRRIEPR